jgi:radical SAM protein with 4Fe4S-binding SPASM domain
MDRARWANIVSARESHETGAVRAGSHPVEAFLEVSARCNLRCQMCAINYDSRYQPRGGRPPFFEPDLFARVRPIFPYLTRAYLFGLGEPLLNRHLVDYVKELSAAGVEVGFVTNATLIDEAKADALARAGVRRVNVSIDGATAETYETIRQGAKFEAVLRGIRALVAARDRYGRPEVNLSMVAMSMNVRELSTMVDLCASLEASGLHVEPLYSQASSAELDRHYQQQNLGAAQVDVAELFAQAASRAEAAGVTFSSRFRGEREGFDYARRSQTVDWTCSEPWTSVWITSAGEVRTCCTNETSFGNLLQTPMEEIWNGAAFQQFRGQHVRKETPAGCSNCMANSRVRHSQYFKAVEPVTYRPIRTAELRSSAREAVSIDWPGAGDVVTDPLLIHGRFLMSGALDYEVMIDHTVAGNLNDATPHSRRNFTVAGDVPYLTEGAHVLWLRQRGQEQGWGHREVHFWRPPAAAGTMRIADAAGIAVASSALRWQTARCYIDGQEWTDVEWTRSRAAGKRYRVAQVDTRKLPPGTYLLEVRARRRVVASIPIERIG